MSSQDNLPFPWEERWSETKSRPYFYNPETKTSQWQSPLKGQPVVKNATETVKPPNTTTKKSSIAHIPPTKSTIKPDKTKSAQIDDDINLPNKKKRKWDEDSTESATKSESSKEKRESFLPRVLRVTEPSKPGKKFPGKSPMSSTTVEGKTPQNRKAPTKKLLDENLKMESELSFESKKKKKKKSKKKRGSVVEKLENGLESESKPVESDGPLVREKTKKNEQEEEEEEMEVEYSPEVQIIFQEIKGVREEMKGMETQEVTSEVQMIVDNMAETPQCSSQKLLVLDTNLFLEDGHLLRNLKDQLSRVFHDGFVFVIPWIVIQEIDRIKDNKHSLTKKFDLRSRARVAVNMIHRWLETKDPMVVGQNPKDAASLYQVKDGFRVENNDDKILHCCLQCHDKYTSRQVALLTLDKNLRNKGMVMGINTFSKETLNKWLTDSTSNKTSISINKTPQPASKIKNYWFTPCTDSTSKSSTNTRVSSKSFSHTPVSIPGLSLSVSSTYQFASPNNSSSFPQTPLKGSSSRCSKSFAPGFNESSLPGAGGLSSMCVDSVPSSAESAFVGNEMPDAVANYCDRQMATIKIVMLDGLSALVERSMKDAYKELWEEILVVKKPWSINKVVTAINKHWIAVFKSFWMRDGQCLVNDLGATLKTRPDSFADLSDVLALCRQLWSSFDPQRWDFQSSCEELASIKKQSLIRISKLEESLKRSRESGTCDSSVLEGPPSFRSSVEMDSSTVPSSTSVAPAAATPCVMPVPGDPVEARVSEEELQRVYECFDAILKHLISLRDLIREELSSSSPDRPNRPIVLQSFIQLGQYVCAIHDQYQRALSENKNINESNVYFELLSTLSSFTQQFNIQVSPISCHALRRFFKDETKRAVVEIGLSQIESIRTSIVDCRQLLTPSESWQLFNN